MKIGKYEIDMSISTVQDFNGMFPIDKGFWFSYSFITRENDLMTGSATMIDWLWQGVDNRRVIMFGFRKWGVWVYINKYKQ